MDFPASVEDERIIPIARGLTAAQAPRLAKALREGGINSLEVTLESGDGLAAIAALAESGITVGAGTVKTRTEAAAAADAGAEFLVSPHLDIRLAEWIVDRGYPYAPGAFTASEVSKVLSLGINTVKLFPAYIGGPQLIRALLGPYPYLRILATGGVTSENAREFINAGAMAVGVGSWLTEHADLAQVTSRARSIRSTLEATRQKG